MHLLAFSETFRDTYTIDSFEDLFQCLRTHLVTGTSVELCGAKLESVKQTTETVQQFNQRFRAVFNELNYATQAEHNHPTERKLASNIEEKSRN